MVSLANRLLTQRPHQRFFIQAADGWELLMAIADIAGEDWPERARDAALLLSAGVGREDESLGVRLLSDIRSCFTTLSTENVFTSSLLDFLNQQDESEWGGWNSGTGITGREVARRLKPYGISPKQVRVVDITKKGYERNSFTDTWERYCPPPIDFKETDETPKLEPIWDGKGTMGSDSNGVSPNPQIQDSYEVSNVSPKPSKDDLRESEDREVLH